MSQSIPKALQYESPRESYESDVFWHTFRFAMIAWSSTVLLRHATYWGDRIQPGNDVRAMVFAGIECVILVLVLINAIKLRKNVRNHHASLAGLCGMFIVAGVVNLVFEFLRVRPPSPLGIVWLIAFRGQAYIIPAMAIIAFVKWRTAPR